MSVPLLWALPALLQDPYRGSRGGTLGNSLQGSGSGAEFGELGVALAPPDWTAIGLALSIVGSFLLANAILFRHPRHMVRERFGSEKARLHTIREYIFHRVQVTLGFTFLLSGFGLQLYGLYRPVPPEARQGFPALWVTLVVVSAIVLLFGGWWWSMWVFRRYVRSYFLENPPQFEADLDMAREVGELFGISSHEDDTVHSYVERLRRVVMLPDPGAAARRAREAELREMEEESDLDGDGLDEQAKRNPREPDEEQARRLPARAGAPLELDP